VRINPLHIDDFKNILATIIEHKFPARWNLFNVGGDEIVDLLVAVRLLERKTGEKARISTPDSEPSSLVGSVQKLKSEIGYLCNTTFETGFTDLIEEKLRLRR